MHHRATVRRATGTVGTARTVILLGALLGSLLGISGCDDAQSLQARVRVVAHKAASIPARLRAELVPDLAPHHGPGDSTLVVRMRVDGRRQAAISPFIYGVNFYEQGPDERTPRWPRGLRLSRLGGNRLSAYNWETNASNAGQDFQYENDGYLCTSYTCPGGKTKAGEVARAHVAGARARGAAIIVTVPMLGFVARDESGEPMGTDEATLGMRLSSSFVRSIARKGAPFADVPDASDAAVYQDEFVHWLTSRFPSAPGDSTPIFFSLDNEPDLWHETHEEIRSRVDGRPQLLTYDDFIARSVEYASAIKDAVPGAMVFGPATATYAGMATLGRKSEPDPQHGTDFFLDVYLAGMRRASVTAGHRLLDVLDVHYYPEAVTRANQGVANDGAEQTEALIEARLQAPRSLWDTTFTERSWVSGVTGGPVRLLPRLRESIARNYPGTRVAISEYYYGRGGDISGGLAQADVLGILGREGVFAATLWPNANRWANPWGGDANKAYAYAIGAFRLFRDYDGRGGTFGDVSLAATTSDVPCTSIYASRFTGDSTKVVLVLINKAATRVTADVALDGLGTFASAEGWTMADGAPVPKPVARRPLVAPDRISWALAPRSAATLVLRR